MKHIVMTCLLAAACSGPTGAQAVLAYRGLCDASAAVALDASHFVVADDERNTLRVYRRGETEPVESLDVSRFLGTSTDKESDLEGAARIAGRIYWISSHGRNAKGKVQQQRHRFFATDVNGTTVPPSLRPVGSAYAKLLDDLIAAPQLAAYKLQNAARQAAEAPGGLNIEGLAATRQGGLLIGFRNPVPNGKALVVPLANPQEVVEGQQSRFGPPVALDLGGRGIRSIELVSSGYLIVAGPPADEGGFALYYWSGIANEAARLAEETDFTSLRPEALFEITQQGQVQVLSDDGGVETNGVACKKRPAAGQAFRSLILTP